MNDPFRPGGHDPFNPGVPQPFALPALSDPTSTQPYTPFFDGSAEDKTTESGNGSGLPAWLKTAILAFGGVFGAAGVMAAEDNDESGLKNIGARGLLILIGVLLIGLGVWMFGAQSVKLVKNVAADSLTGF